jgi:hypothetical protein
MIFASGMTPTLAATVLKRIRPVETYGAPRARGPTAGGGTEKVAHAARLDIASTEGVMFHSLKAKLASDFWFAYRLLARSARINS